MAKIIYVRHAQSECNAKLIDCLVGADPEITNRGKFQAHEAGKLLYQEYGNNFDFLVISNLTRTNQTAAILNIYVNIRNIIYDNDLRERGARYYGEKYHDKIGSKINYDFHGITDSWEEGFNNIFVPRVVNSMCNHLLAEAKLGIVVAHGFVGKALSRYFFGEEVSLDNCASLVFDPSLIENFSQKCQGENSLQHADL